MSENNMFNSGQSMELFKVIENDFIDYLTYVPLNPKHPEFNETHLKVCSPRLADMLLRICSQIEIFFKEWLKLQEFNDRTDVDLVRGLRKNKKGKKIKPKMNDYITFMNGQNGIKQKLVKIVLLDENKALFDDANNNNVPEWWTAYNKTKHDGFKELKEANLKNVIESLAALFLLHCLNRHNVKTSLVKYHMTEVTDSGMAQINGDIERKVGPPALRVIRTPEYYGYFLFEWREKVIT